MVNCLSSNLPNSLLVESRHGIVSPEYLATIRLHVRDKQNENLYCKSSSRCLLFGWAVRPLPSSPSILRGVPNFTISFLSSARQKCHMHVQSQSPPVPPSPPWVRVAPPSGSPSLWAVKLEGTAARNSDPFSEFCDRASGSPGLERTIERLLLMASVAVC